MGRSKRRSRFVQIGFLCSIALTLWCLRLGVIYDGWAWFWASLALTVCAGGVKWRKSRAARVGGVAALAAFLSGIAQGADQGLPIWRHGWQDWQVAAAAMWVLGAGLLPRNSRYWRELLCSLAIPCIYIYELVNGDNQFRALIEVAFAAMLLPSIGGIGGRLSRILRDAYRNRGRSNGGRVGVASARETEVGMESPSASLRID